MGLLDPIKEADKKIRTFVEGNALLSLVVALVMLLFYLKLIVFIITWSPLPAVLFGIFVFYLAFHAFKAVLENLLGK